MLVLSFPSSDLPSINQNKHAGFNFWDPCVNVKKVRGRETQEVLLLHDGTELTVGDDVELRCGEDDSVHFRGRVKCIHVVAQAIIVEVLPDTEE